MEQLILYLRQPIQDLRRSAVVLKQKQTGQKLIATVGAFEWLLCEFLVTVGAVLKAVELTCSNSQIFRAAVIALLKVKSSLSSWLSISGSIDAPFWMLT